MKLAMTVIVGDHGEYRIYDQVTNYKVEGFTKGTEITSIHHTYWHAHRYAFRMAHQGHNKYPVGQITKKGPTFQSVEKRKKS